MSEKPVPCPVCGRRTKTEVFGSSAYVYCFGCQKENEYHTVDVKRKTKAEAISAWNKAFGKGTK
jgi:hypothetical protein